MNGGKIRIGPSEMGALVGGANNLLPEDPNECAMEGAMEGAMEFVVVVGVDASRETEESVVAAIESSEAREAGQGDGRAN